MHGVSHCPGSAKPAREDLAGVHLLGVYVPRTAEHDTVTVSPHSLVQKYPSALLSSSHSPSSSHTRPQHTPRRRQLVATMRLTTPAVAAVAVVSAVLTGVAAIQQVTRAGRYLYTADGNRFLIKGIAYQEQGALSLADFVLGP